jgi:Ca-activated chloride channel family protein
LSFQQPWLLLGLLLVLALVGVYLLAQRRRRKFTLLFTDVALLSSVVGRRPGYRKHLPPALFLLGAAALVVAMAQPILNLEVARNDASVMMVIDTSGSMDATDVSPNRLEAARQAARTLLNQLPSGDRAGLVTFSSSPVLAAPLSDSRDQVNAAIDSLVPGGATATGDALTLALQQLTQARTTAGAARAPAMIVLVTDGGWNRGSDPAIAAAQAKSASVVINTVGVGSRGGAVTVHGQDVGGVDEQALAGIASTTGGKYYFAEEAGQLKQIYAALGTQFAYRPLRFDATVPMVVVGALVVVIGAGLSLWWFRVLP